MTLFKYVGEMSRSAFEFGKNHLDDKRLLSTKSHMLKHYLISHPEDAPSDMIFRIKILGFSRSAYERQIKESVVIQTNRRHTLLNSKSEFNRCSLPRGTVKMGEWDINEMARMNEQDRRAEDALEKVITEMKKQSKKRAHDGVDDISKHQQQRKKRQRMDS